MSSSTSSYLLPALLGILHLAGEEVASLQHAERRDNEDLGSDEANEAFLKAQLAVRRYWQDHKERSEVWQLAVRHNDIEGAARLCSQVENLTLAEAKVMVTQYAIVTGRKAF